MKFTKMWVWLCVVACLLFACKSTDREQKKVAIVISTLNNPWFVVLADSAKERVEELGYEAVVFDSQDNASMEKSYFDNIIASGFSGILLNPTDADQSVANVQAAADAGIPVFCMDREINQSGLATCQILSNNYSGCVKLGELFVSVVGPTAQYAELLGLEGDNNTWRRSEGFHSVVDKYPDLQIVAKQHADFDRNKAAEVFGSMLQAYPDITAVFCGNDAMALGAYQAAVSADKADKIAVFGFDGEAAVLESIAEGKIVATGMQSPGLMAKYAAELLHQYLQGDNSFSRNILIDVDVVTKDNVSDYL